MNIKIGTSYVDINIDIEEKGRDITYKYILDNNEITSINENRYTIENLEPETEYNIKIIITDGKKEIIQTKTIKTESRTYLYKGGEEYSDITGGWEKAFSTYSGTGKKETSYLYCYSPIHNGVFSTYYFKTVNKIKLQEYTKICFETTTKIHSYGNGGVFLGFGAWNGIDFEYYRSSMIKYPRGENISGIL